MRARTNSTVTPYDFRLEVCDVSPSKRPDLVVSIIPFIVEINIYENLGKPYLTGDIVVSDTIGLYPHMDIKGIDRVKIGVKLPDDDAAVTERTFYIDRVINSTRTNDNEIVYVLHIIEEHAFLSNNIMVNEILEGGFGSEGSGTQIIKNVFRNYFGRDIVIDGDAEQSAATGDFRFREITPPTRYIAPNITPLAVAQTIKERMIDEKHTPYFLYSSLVGENVFLQSLMDMLIYNSRYKNSFRFSQAFGQGERDSLSLETQQFNIESYTDTSTLDITKINNAGFLNSMFYFYDVTRAQPFNPHHNDETSSEGSITPGLLGNHWTAHGMFNSNNLSDIEGPSARFAGANEALKYLYPENAVLPWESETGRSDTQFNQNEVRAALLDEVATGPIEALHKRPAARQIINMFASAGFVDGYGSYNENPRSDAQASYLNLVDAHALKEWISSDPIDFVVPGRLFLSRSINDNTYNTSIGRIANLQFTTLEGNTVIPDLKRSGDHLLYAARHMFSIAEGYKVQFTGVKVNPISDTSVSGNIPTNALPPDPEPDTSDGVLV